MGHAFHLCGVDHELWLSRSGTLYRVHIGATCVPVTLVARGEHTHELTVRDASERVVIAHRGDDVHIHLDGEAYLLRYSHSLERLAGQAVDAGEAIARAPMPGAVIAVSTEAGAVVRRGQALLVIESMKMETTITAPCDGVVQAVHVDVGQNFDRDAALVTLERANEAP
jgi:3-methylcrotonyl-CoA carboxylase alpha subunit